jgi:hypothetical protein
MPHVDEGLLHAYLDGALDALREAGALPHGTTRESIDAHLALCADCRALLETERTIRTRAGAVLDAVAPVVDVPPFSELFATRARRAPRRRFPLAWAASVLLALGAGWIANEVFRAQETSVLDELRAPAAPAVDNLAREPQNSMTQPELRDQADVVPEPAPAPVAPAPVTGAAGGAAMRDAEESGEGAVSRRRPERVANEVRVAAPPAAQRTPASASVGEGARIAGAEAHRRAESGDTGRAGGAPLGRTLSTPSRDTVIARQGLAAAAPPPPVAPARGHQERAETIASRADVAAYAKADASVTAFRSSLAELDADDIPLTTGAVPPELPNLRLEGGSVPTIERGTRMGVTLTRITQRAASGIAVELIVWRQTQLELSQLVVTGAAGRRERDSAAARNAPRPRAEAELARKQRASRAPFAHTVIASSALADGRRELLLRSADGTIFVALRAAVSESDLQSLGGRLVDMPRD